MRSNAKYHIAIQVNESHDTCEPATQPEGILTFPDSIPFNDLPIVIAQFLVQLRLDGNSLRSLTIKAGKKPPVFNDSESLIPQGIIIEEIPDDEPIPGFESLTHGDLTKLNDDPIWTKARLIAIESRDGQHPDYRRDEIIQICNQFHYRYRNHEAYRMIAPKLPF